MAMCPVGFQLCGVIDLCLCTHLTFIVYQNEMVENLLTISSYCTIDSALGDSHSSCLQE